MTLPELSEYLQKEGMLYVHIGNALKQYVPGSKVFTNNQWCNMIDVFGIYQGVDGKYCFFITDSERGIPEYSDVFDKEEEACKALIEKILRAERIFHNV